MLRPRPTRSQQSTPATPTPAGRTSKHRASQRGHRHHAGSGGNARRAVTRTRRANPSLGAIVTKRGWRPAVYKKDARLARQAQENG
jgi:hypothetical protein